MEQTTLENRIDQAETQITHLHGQISALQTRLQTLEEPLPALPAEPSAEQIIARAITAADKASKTAPEIAGVKSAIAALEQKLSQVEAEKVQAEAELTEQQRQARVDVATAELEGLAAQLAELAELAEPLCWKIKDIYERFNEDFRAGQSNPYAHLDNASHYRWVPAELVKFGDLNLLQVESHPEQGNFVLKGRPIDLWATERQQAQQKLRQMRFKGGS